MHLVRNIVHEQFVNVFDGHEAFCLRDGVNQAAGQGGLAGSCFADDQQVPFFLHDPMQELANPTLLLQLQKLNFKGT